MIIKMGLERIFAVIGLIVTMILVLMLLIDFVFFIYFSIEKIHKRHKINRELKHRFDKPPVAKCYCLYCKYAEYFGDDRCGKCSLWGNDIVIKDNSFCYRADPKTMLKE